MPGNGSEQEQASALVAAVESVLGENIVGVYLYGSAVSGGLKPHSDVDMLGIVRAPTTREHRLDLVRRLRPLSRRGERPAEWRPVELTLVAQADVKPLSVRPRTDFQYGEWLRAELDAGQVDPSDPANPDLLVLLAQVRRSSTALLGPDASGLIAEVPPEQLRNAMLASVDGLVADLEADTTNVLLTLARIWTTLQTGDFVAKDAAAEWARARIGEPASSALVHAAAVYRGEVEQDWAEHDVNSAARLLTQAIRHA